MLVSLFNSLAEMKKKHAAEIKELNDQHKQKVEDLHNQIKILQKALEESAIQNKVPGATNITHRDGRQQESKSYFHHP